MHDLIHSLSIIQSVAPQSVQASTVVSSAIDMQGCESLALAVAVGTTADALDATHRLDIKLEHADDDGAGAPGAYSACTLADLVGVAAVTAGVFVSIDAAGKASKRYTAAYVGGKRFVRVSVAPVTLTAGVPVAILALKGNLAQQPQT